MDKIRKNKKNATSAPAVRRTALKAIAWDSTTSVIFALSNELRLKAHYIAKEINTSFAEVARNAFEHAIANWEQAHGEITRETLMREVPQAPKSVPRLKREIFPEAVVIQKNTPQLKRAVNAPDSKA